MCIKLIPIAQRFISQYVGRVYLCIWYKLQTLYIYGYLYIYIYRVTYINERVLLI